ncbi:hypothetical protein AXW38_09905 [Yersinia ruckeri]|uniref:hypothetical protein n=1 Tax=Yersinia ruckeri TaxID=29486 RepID=UPI0004E420A2|nr:hypothetical protein [Yersinia ruckeri]ARZ01314.1 hypothetical protein QMA0440_01981 [Yersinia ruckeri]EKN4700359.1 hypothetical protein [Yersinia ruckeri]ELM3740228.1 hypothetical protein [Yersinia ruckeri]KFE37341.1 hypothetical protein nADLYRO1b_3300 [Yersinia ruckeri]MCW6563899.1 hypothetical protein [Yersinia ruckeri]
MIELNLKTVLEQLTGLAVYPLLLPDSEQEGVTYQRISDPAVATGLVRTPLVAARFQITFYLLDDYARLLQWDQSLWQTWKIIQHGDIAGYPVQYVTRGGMQQDCITQNNNQVQYRYVRDYILYYREGIT